MNRADGRAPSDLRTTRLTPGFLAHPEGSVLIEAGKTNVICTASVEDRVPPFLAATARAGSPPNTGCCRARPRRARRARRRGQSRRTDAGDPAADRSIAAIGLDLDGLGERTIWVDCDVIQADGGTRTAAITGGFVALVLALEHMRKQGELQRIPITDYVAATSVGVIGGVPMLDLAYEEDSRADVDMNVIQTSDGRFIEVQGTAEGAPFERKVLDELLESRGRRHPPARRAAAHNRRAILGR